MGEESVSTRTTLGKQIHIGSGQLDLAGSLDDHRAFIGPEHVVIDLTNRCNARKIRTANITRGRFLQAAFAKRRIEGDT